MAAAAESAGPADPSRCAAMSCSRSCRSRTRPSCTYVSSPNEWAKPPVGNSPSANCSKVRSPGSAVMALRPSDRLEGRAHPLEPHAEPRQHDVHARVIGDEEALAVQRQVEMAVTHLERHAQRLLARGGRDRQTRLDGAFDDDEPIRADV